MRTVQIHITKYFFCARLIILYTGTCILLFSTSLISGGYQPPIGIPAPSFGIEENMHDIYGEGYYTYYIDNTAPNATDVNNLYGTAEKPRMTIPNRLFFLNPGTVMKIYGGPYTFNFDPIWAGMGTAEQPIFICGGDPSNKAIISNCHIVLGGSYLIFENLELSPNTNISISQSTPDHVVIRNCDIYNPEDKIITYGSAVSAGGEDIVIYKNHIHHHWQANDIDCHGVVPMAGARRVWVLDNHIHHCSGDAFQATHAASLNPARYVYVGRNVMHDDRENGVDLKFVKDIVISQNIIYGYKDASTSDGSAVVLGSDGMPNRVWVIFNEIFNSRNGIRNEETDVAWLIGNRIHHIEGFAIGLEKKSDDLYVIGNTVYDVNLAIDQFGPENFRLHIFDNIFAQIRNSSLHLDIASQSVADSSEMSQNLFWQGEGESVVIRWGSGNQKSYFSSADFVGFEGGSNNIIGDPLFSGPAVYDFSIGPGSAAIDAGSEHASYDAYEALFGINIKSDCIGTPRPQGEMWDIGAYEFTTTTGIAESHSRPDRFTLHQNYPNPFNPITTINYELPITNYVELSIYNSLGEKVETLIAKQQISGSHQIQWNASRFASGVYLCRLQSNYGLSETRKMLLIK